MRKKTAEEMIFMCIGLAVSASMRMTTALPTLPFSFGNAMGDIFTLPGDTAISSLVVLRPPMAYVNRSVYGVRQNVKGYVYLDSSIDPLNFSGYVDAYFMDIDTSNGGVDQNQMWFRAGNSISDLQLARDIIAGNGTLFAPQAMFVATWYKVEAAVKRAGPQNTFQLAMAYSETGETWVIYAYSQLEYFASSIKNVSSVGYSNKNAFEVQRFFTINSTATMNSLLNGTNCNRTGTYVYRINKGGPTKAPTKAPSKAPTKAPSKAPIKAPLNVPTVAPTAAKCGLLGGSIVCPFTFCGILGRWLGFCHST